MSLVDSALILIGHGSTLNPDSSTPTYLHAAAIRRRNLFREVACAFWKEEPGMREVFEMVQSRSIYIVPNFISEGYFCQQVLPRELRLEGPVTRRDGRVIRYCDPVGIHPNMTRLLLQRAEEVAPGVPRSETSLIIVGHGTSLNENSAKAIQTQVQLIREGGHGFAEVLDAYMEEAPFVADWHKNTQAPNVVVVPFFISDGLHSYQDIPVLLGMAEEPGKALSESDVFHRNPNHLNGRNLYYSGAIGTEPLMAEVILDQVAAFDQQHGELQHDGAQVRDIGAALASWLKSGRDLIGEAAITPRGEASFTLCHRDEVEALKGSSASLQEHRGPDAALELARYDDHGKFRPLKSAPSLKHGWRLELTSLSDLKQALDFLYPAALGMIAAEEGGALTPVPLRETLGRQTGMYRFANRITDEQAIEMVANTCATGSKCLRRICWELTAGQPLTGPAAAKTCSQGEEASGSSTGLPLLCMEACCHVISAARKIAKENHQSSVTA